MLALLTFSAPLRAADNPRETLFAALKQAANEADAREVEARIWSFWFGLGDAESRRLFEVAREAQLRFDYGTALVALEALVEHAPDYAEGWNQLAYVRFLAGSYQPSLEALDRAIALEPMHYAALAGKGIVLIEMGREAEAQPPLKAALAINPWLKERALIVK